MLQMPRARRLRDRAHPRPHYRQRLPPDYDGRRHPRLYALGRMGMARYWAFDAKGLWKAVCEDGPICIGKACGAAMSRGARALRAREGRW